MSDRIRWGIIGTGSIARQFARGLQHVPDAELMAVGSRSQQGADVFGDMFSVPRRYSSYDALAADSDVDVVYISTPHPMHYENSLLCLNAGKAVLCEKPFTINAGEARALIERARARRLFLMEAMWTRFFPAMYRLRDLLAQGVIGNVRLLQADFGFQAPFDPQNRLFALELGGGALLDVGVYVVSFASMVLGTPRQVVSLADIGATGVDEQAAMVLGYDGGRLAVLSTAVRTETPQEALICGTAGRIRVHRQFFQPRKLTVEVYGREHTEIEMPIQGNGYHYQAVEVARCLRAGQLESEIMPLDETLAIMETLDRIRAPWGLRYPTESRDLPV